MHAPKPTLACPVLRRLSCLPRTANLPRPPLSANPHPPPAPPRHCRPQVEHYLKSGMDMPMPRSNDAAFKRSYKKRTEDVRSVVSPHIEWDPME